MKKILKVFVIFFSSLMFAVNFIQCMEQQEDPYFTLFKQVNGIQFLQKDICKTQKRIIQNIDDIRDQGYEIICNTDNHKQLRKETPILTFCNLWLKKRVVTVSFIFGERNTECCIIPSFQLPNDEESEDRPFNDIYQEARTKAIKKGVWNPYTKAEDKYCLKTKLLFSAPFALGLSILWYQYCPTYLHSFWNRILLKF